MTLRQIITTPVTLVRSLFARKTVMRPGDAAFMNDVQESLLSQTTPGSNRVLYLMALVFMASLIWAGFARVEEITQGEAKIISLSREQIIQSLEGGILLEMEVQEGDVVERGQVLLKIDPTRAHSSYREFFSKALGLKAAIVRLKAEAFDQPLEFDDMVSEEPEIIAQETRTYQAHRRALKESLDALDRSYQLTLREISLAKPLVAQGLMSEVEMLRMERQANEIKSQMIERKNKFRADANAELTRFEMELSQVTENLVGRADVVDRTTITAPVRGTVKNVRVNTIGGVIQPGEHILEIVPLEEQLLIEGKIKPSDVAFLRPGLPAMVKITAYDFSVYGGLKGQVQYVSPDTLKDEQKAAAGRQDDTYYRVLVLTNNSTLDVGDKKLPIIPGMVATVEIRTGEKTILDYLLKPVLKAREAFRER